MSGGVKIKNLGPKKDKVRTSVCHGNSTSAKKIKTCTGFSSTSSLTLSEMKKPAAGIVGKLKKDSSMAKGRPDSSLKVVRVGLGCTSKKRNMKNRNIDPAKKIDMRDTFITKLLEANSMPEGDYPTVKDITSVLIRNKLPVRVTENRNLYKFFGKGTTRAPSKELYLAMKTAVETDNLKTTKTKVSRAIVVAERERIHREVERLIQEKAKDDSAVNSSSSVTGASTSTSKGMKKFVVKPVFPSTGPSFNHSLKIHIASLFYDEISHYQTDRSTETEDERLELKVEDEFGRLILLPGMVRAFQLKVTISAPELIISAQKLLHSYLKLD